jgi:hypothetical protein
MGMNLENVCFALNLDGNEFQLEINLEKWNPRAGVDACRRLRVLRDSQGIK